MAAPGGGKLPSGPQVPKVCNTIQSFVNVRFILNLCIHVCWCVCKVSHVMSLPPSTKLCAYMILRVSRLDQFIQTSCRYHLPFKQGYNIMQKPRSTKGPETQISYFKVPPDERPGTSNEKDEKVVVVSQSTEHQGPRPEHQSKDNQLCIENEDCLRRPGPEVSTNVF